MNITLYNLYDQKILNIFLIFIIYYLYNKLSKSKKYNDKIYELEETNKFINKKIDENIKLLFDFEKTIIETINKKISELKEINNGTITKLKKDINETINTKIGQNEITKLKEDINEKNVELIKIFDTIDKKIKENNNIPFFTHTYSSNEICKLGNKRQIEFFDIYINKIHFNYHFMRDGDIEIYYNSKLYISNNYSDLIKFINLLKNINLISIDILKSESTKSLDLITLIEIKYFDVIKEICKLNKNVKLEINIYASNYKFNNLQYLFSDIKHENITDINIKYTDLLIDVNKQFNEYINKKIMLIPGK